MRLNDLDERIVHALAEDARRSYADIGQEVGLSAPAVKRRVDRLRADGAITGFTVRVDPAALGWETEGFIEIFCRRNTSPDAIHRGLSRYPEVGGAPAPHHPAALARRAGGGARTRTLP
ncbi:Lrp/AsnC family transcriptional regulator, partial [Streptomyces sp. NPDC059152]|uniref:Lrp/AsnC family transcriptional regulator n=1 Tax=Streptomyces sp. NPDC059152 TaxID=3346742 RepID=UPI0036824B26